jgi:hypothetical protein
MWVSTRMDPARDITVTENTPIDYLDSRAPVGPAQDRPRRHDKFPGETNREGAARSIWISGGRQGRRDELDPGKRQKIWR